MSAFTCFLYVCAVFRVAWLRTQAHHVHSVHSEYVLVPHDQVRHDAVSASILLKNGVPFLPNGDAYRSSAIVRIFWLTQLYRLRHKKKIYLII